MEGTEGYSQSSAYCHMFVRTCVNLIPILTYVMLKFNIILNAPLIQMLWGFKYLIQDISGGFLCAIVEGEILALADFKEKANRVYSVYLLEDCGFSNEKVSENLQINFVRWEGQRT